MMIELRSSRSFPGEIDSVWRDVVDIELHPGFVDHVYGARILSQPRADSRTCAWTLGVGDDTLAWIAAEHLDHDRRELRFAQVAGSLDRFDGVWRVQPAGSRTVVSVAVDCDTRDARLMRVLGPRGAHLQRVLDRWLLALERWVTVPDGRSPGS